MRNLFFLGLLAAILLPAVHAQENSTDREPRPMPVRERIETRTEMKNEMKKERKEKLHEKAKTHAQSMFDYFFADLDETTQTEIRNLFSQNRDAVQEIRENFKTQFESAETPESREEIYDTMKTELESLHAEFHAELRTFVPENLLDEFDTKKLEADQKIEQVAQKREELRTQRNEMKNRNFSERTQRLAGRVSIILDQIVSRVSDTDAKIALLDRLASGIQNSLDRLDERNLDESAIADRRDLLTAVLDQIQLLKSEMTASPDELVAEIESLLDL